LFRATVGRSSQAPQVTHYRSPISPSAEARTGRPGRDGGRGLAGGTRCGPPWKAAEHGRCATTSPIHPPLAATRTRGCCRGLVRILRQAHRVSALIARSRFDYELAVAGCPLDLDGPGTRRIGSTARPSGRTDNPRSSQSTSTVISARDTRGRWLATRSSPFRTACLSSLVAAKPRATDQRPSAVDGLDVHPESALPTDRRVHGAIGAR
jgi:hypothetical protein